MDTVNLNDSLWDHSAESAEYECTAKQIAEFISLRMDNDEFAEFESYDQVEVPDSDVAGWVEQFKLWLNEEK